MRKATSVLLILICTCNHLIHATIKDSIPFSPRQTAHSYERKLDKIISSHAYQMTYIGVPLVIGGMIVKSEDDHFRQLRNDYMPSFRQHYDDYLQYLPTAAMLGMKIGGVEGRSSWGRMLASDAFTVAIMSTVVSQLKVKTKVMRPDGSNNHSFPSGHTATAFMTATMLHKEYGDISPWISIGAYSAATATGLMRMANNKHWLSDIMAGAGIGILSTELGYFITDLIFKDKGLLKSSQSDFCLDKKMPPSFLGLYMGFNIPLSKYDLDEHTTLKTSSGSTSGIEGAYFFNPYLGFGGRFTISNLSFLLNDNEAQNQTFSFTSFYTGGYFSYPLSSRLAVGSKLLAGYTHYNTLQLPYSTIKANGGLCLGSGLSLLIKVKPKLNFRFLFDYNLIPPHSVNTKEYMHTLTLGGMVAVTL